MNIKYQTNNQNLIVQDIGVQQQNENKINKIYTYLD